MMSRVHWYKQNTYSSDVQVEYDTHFCTFLSRSLFYVKNLIVPNVHSWLLNVLAVSIQYQISKRCASTCNRNKYSYFDRSPANKTRCVHNIVVASTVEPALVINLSTRYSDDDDAKQRQAHSLLICFLLPYLPWSQVSRKISCVIYVILLFIGEFIYVFRHW